jgi:hypothetical protein
MRRSPSLPKQIRYLQSFRKILNRLEPEEFNEDMDQSVLHQLVLKRTEGMSVEEAMKVLEADRSALKNWLSEHAPDDEPLHWLEAQLSVLPDLIEELRKQPLEQKPKFKVEMEIPKGARSRGLQHGGLKMIWNRTTLFAVPVEPQHLEMSLKLSSGPGDRITQTNFAEVKGHKRVRPDYLSVGVHTVDYFLEVPGGGVEVGLIKKGDFLDEMEFERFFHTIRLVQRD